MVDEAPRRISITNDRKSVASSNSGSTASLTTITKILLSPEFKQLLDQRKHLRDTLLSFSVIHQTPNSQQQSNNTSLYDSRDDIPVSSLGPLHEWNSLTEKLNSLTQRLETQYQAASSTVNTLMGSMKESNNNSNTGIPVSQQYSQFSNETQNLYNEYGLALYYYALSLYIRIYKSSPLVGRGIKGEEFYNLINTALNTVEKSSKTRMDDVRTSFLWGMILIEKVKQLDKDIIAAPSKDKLHEHENTLMICGEKFVRVLEILEQNPTSSGNKRISLTPNQNAAIIRTLKEIMDKIMNSQKERSRTGKAIYHIAGELHKEGGSYKSWKSRWFVVDDSSIVYWKDKNEWELGPVKGTPAKSQGSISFGDVLDITSHEDASKCSGIKHRPKDMPNGPCLHLLTKNRTYNIIGFENERQQQLWVSTLKNAFRLYNVKKKAKKYIKDTKSEKLPSLEETLDLLDPNLDDILVIDASSASGMAKNPSNGSSSGNTQVVTLPARDEEEANSRSSYRQSWRSKDNKEWTSPPKRAKDYKRGKGSRVELRFDDPAESGEFTFDKLGSIMRDVDDRSARKYTHLLLEEFQKDGTLIEMIMSLVEDDPKQFIQNVTDISDFQRAKFGGLKKMERILTLAEEGEIELDEE